MNVWLDLLALLVSMRKIGVQAIKPECLDTMKSKVRCRPPMRLRMVLDRYMHAMPKAKRPNRYDVEKEVIMHVSSVRQPTHPFHQTSIPRICEKK